MIIKVEVESMFVKIIIMEDFSEFEFCDLVIEVVFENV